MQKLRSTKDPNVAKGILKFSKRVEALFTSSKMHSNLVSAVFNFGSDEILKKGKGKKVKVSEVTRPYVRYKEDEKPEDTVGQPAYCTP